MSIKIVAKRIITGIVSAIILIAVGIWGYWKYVNWKLEQNPFYFYKPRPYTRFVQEWNETMQKEDSINQDSIILIPTE